MKMKFLSALKTDTLSERKKLFLSIATIVFLTAIIYWQSFSFELIYFDDDSLLLNHEEFTTTEIIYSAVTSNYLNGHYYRPIVSLSLIADSQFGNTFSHLLNYFIHLLVCSMLFLFLVREKIPMAIATCAVLLFGMNAIHANAVGWIAGRGDLLSALFTMVGMLFVQKYFTKGETKYLLLSLLIIFFAALSKESALLVSILFLIKIIFHQPLLKEKFFTTSLAVAALLFFYFIMRIFLSSHVNIDKFSFEHAIMNWFIPFETISKFFTQQNINALNSFNHFSTAIGIAIFLLLISLPFLLREIDKLKYYFGLIWFFVLFIPSMSFRTMSNEIFYYWDSRSYLPLIGIAFSVAELFKALYLKISQKIYYVTLIAALFYAGLAAFDKLSYYRNAETYWSEVGREYSHSSLPNVALFNFYSEKKNTKEAEKQLKLAINKNPKDLSLKQKLVNFYKAHNEQEKSFLLLKEMIFKERIEEQYFIDLFISEAIEMKKYEELKLLIDEFELSEEIRQKIFFHLQNER